MELVPLIVDLLIETSIYRLCPIAMFDCRRLRSADVSVDLIHFVKKGGFHAKRGKNYDN